MTATAFGAARSGAPLAKVRPRSLIVVGRRAGREAAAALLALLMVVVAVVAAEVIEAQAPRAQLAPIFVIPVVASAAYLRPTAAIFAVLAAAAAYDFFFTTPLYTLAVDNSGDLVTLGVLFVVAGLVSGVAARARGATRLTRAAAERAETMHQLAATALSNVDDLTLLTSAAATLRKLSRRACVFASVETGPIHIVAQSGGVQLSSGDMEAARWVIREGKHYQAGNYPYFGSSYDFWPTTRNGLVVGLRLWDPNDRVLFSDQDLELVLGYVALGGH